MMITKHNLTFMLLLQSPERETGDRLNSGAFYSFDSKAVLVRFTQQPMKRDLLASKKVQLKEVQKVAEVCCPKCAPETYSPSWATSSFGGGRSGPPPSTIVGPLHAPHAVVMPSSSSITSSVSASIVSSIPSAKASPTSVAVSWKNILDVFVGKRSFTCNTVRHSGEPPKRDVQPKVKVETW